MTFDIFYIGYVLCYNFHLTELSLFQSEIQFIDYGNNDIKHHSNIVEVSPEFQHVPPFSKRHRLYGLAPVHDKGSKGYLKVGMLPFRLY